MARITVEDCLKKVDNRFTLIHMAAKRVRQLRKGAEQTIVSKNKDIVVSLREIVAGNVVKAEVSEQNHLAEAEADLLPETTEEKDDQKAPAKEQKKTAEVAEGD
jgi:DNA-directed RNA polymerase subunit omega